MYINKIDDLLDKIIDDFYNSVVTKSKNFNKLLSEINFAEYQSDINNIIIEYVKSININEIRQLVQNEENVITIIDIIKRYIAYYIFLMIGAFYTGKTDIYINNIIEFSNKQAEFDLKIPNFFNSENNATIIKYYSLVKNILTILATDQEKLSSFLNNLEYKDTIEFLNTLGTEYIDQNFRIDDRKEQAHNIIKTIIILNLYKKYEKKEVFKILESVESSKDDYIFIDVVLPTKQYIDYNAVENILTKREIYYGLVDEFWKYIRQHEEGTIAIKDTMDNKLLKLINSGILVPIVDDFLLYHKDTEKYDKHVTDPTKIKKEGGYKN